MLALEMLKIFQFDQISFYVNERERERELEKVNEEGCKKEKE